ncbi:MAG: SDR family NAD(P)-dependent oxidoreductase, partial [Mycobacterium sp.]
GYRLPQLVSDIGAVIDSLRIDAVHLLAHDWGSIQGWAAVTDDALMDRIASFTSISGPHLNYAGKFLRSARTPRAVADVAKQFLASSYIWFFLCPKVPEVAIRSRATVKVFEAVGRIGRSSSRSQHRVPPRSIRDYLNGLNLYRANMPGPLLAPGPRLPQTAVPVQVLVPRKDYFVSPALQRFTGSIPAGSRVISIEGGHWVVSARPDVIARLTSEWVTLIGEGAAPVGASVVGTGPRAVRGKLALVTGAGAGTGRATAVELARRGAAAVVVVDQDLAAANDTAEAVRAAGAEAAVYQVDVSDEAALNSLAAQVHNKHGVVDILVNDATIGVMYASRAFDAQMIERGQGGTIINVSSAAACLPPKSAHGTTEAALLAFSESLRAELAAEGITVTAVCPGIVNTTPEATAKAIVKAVRTGPAVLPIAAESRITRAIRRILKR